MSTTPSADDLRLAALWIEQNEGTPDEQAPLLRVAAWLERQADAQILRSVAREQNVPVSVIRQALTKRAAKESAS